MTLLRRGTPDEVAVLRERLRRVGSTAREAARPDAVAAEASADAIRVADTVAEWLRAPAPHFVPWIRQPTSIAPVLAAWRMRASGRRVDWIDLDGSRGACGVWFLLAQSLRLALFALLDLLARGLGHLNARLISPAAPLDPPATDREGPLWIVLPILPDLSHTFVYREAAQLIEQAPDSRLLVLERGTNIAPDHGEARALRPHARFTEPRGILRHYFGIFATMLLHPRRASRMLRRYTSRPEGLARLFGRLPLREPRHPGNAFALAALLRREVPGPIHVYGSTYATNVVMGACDLLGWSYSLTSYVDFDFAYEHRMLADKVATSRFFRVCTGFCQTRLLELVPGTAAADVPVILFGLDLSAWGVGAAPSGENVLFSACRIVPKKGLHHMPAALAALARRGVHCSWRIAGDGPERERIAALASEHGVADRVEWLGGVPTAAVSDELRRADLAVLPCVVAQDGERDGIPIFLTEAMALGVPVLTTPVSGIPELIEDGVTGYLAAPDDVDALTDRLAAALSDSTQRARIAAAGRDTVHARLDIQASARDLLDRIRSR